ncbi:uncharacterized protein PG998_008857 [Apiospora kogelbergensis]|uniref:uncharacterized protein n=1 Tax=Apiospora kogelbergensis TaxID=1337665 RepID=UPI003131330F
MASYSEYKSIHCLFNYAPYLADNPLQLILRFFPVIDDRVTDLKEELRKLNDQYAEGNDHRSPHAALETGKELKHSVEASYPRADIRGQEDKAQDRSSELEENNDTKTQAEKALRKQNLLDRIAHLACLRNFISSELKDKVEMCKSIREGSLESITFENLWHLYSPGDIVVFKQKEGITLLKIYSVAGGQMQHRARGTNENEPSKRQRQTMDVNGKLSKQSEEDAVESLSRREIWGLAPGFL